MSRKEENTVLEIDEKLLKKETTQPSVEEFKKEITDLKRKLAHSQSRGDRLVKKLKKERGEVYYREKKRDADKVWKRKRVDAMCCFLKEELIDIDEIAESSYDKDDSEDDDDADIFFKLDRGRTIMRFV